ncbi:uncharacterized protein LOC133821108 [Humulus lupulus]|uniref:uncharacterized protein LOC133821108 n=1 Tax=Humulus lupulus TaxID=3486 RepID=UPI002B417DEE|nr:uncharacterized protein LOC133821108 [Humulus lupulus]
MSTTTATTLTTPFLSLPPPRSYNPSSSSGNYLARRRLATWKPRGKAVCALHRDAFDHGYDGRLVDQGMIVLRKRIHEVKAAEVDEDGDDDVVSSDWMEWEKEYYAKNYGADVCEAVGMLQCRLMNTRPSLSLVLLGVVSLSVPISMGVVLLRLMDVAKDVFVGFS